MIDLTETCGRLDGGCDGGRVHRDRDQIGALVVEAPLGCATAQVHPSTGTAGSIVETSRGKSDEVSRR